MEHVYPIPDPCNPHPDSDYVWLSGPAMPGGFGIPSLCATHWETSADGPESGRVQRCLGPLERSESPFDADNFHTEIMVLVVSCGIQFQEIMMWPESIEWYRLGTFPIKSPLAGVLHWAHRDSAVVGGQCDLTARGFAGRHSDQTFLCLSPLWEVVDQIWCFRCDSQILATVGRLAEGVHATLFFDFEIHRAPVNDSQVNSTWCQMINQTQHQGRYNWCGSARILLLPGGAIAILSPCVWTLAAGAWMMTGLELAMWPLWLYWSLTSEFCNVSKNLFPSPWIRAQWR